MSNALPILASIKSEWKAVSEPPFLGKDVLELLSSSMYVNPLSIYREYVQNAVDSIDEAVALGQLRRSDEGRIEIAIDSQARSVRIRDNGTGVPESQFVKRLIALGASRKRGHKARGFRGVGRLAGLGYCQELVFRSRADGDRQVSELRWDCRQLKNVLRDAHYSEQLGQVISQVVRMRKSVDSTYPDRFFEVELIGLIRHGADRLMNASAVASYLSQVAPVPFAPSFSLAEKIESALVKHVSLGNVGIFINDSPEPLYRPHRDTFVARKGHEDKHIDVEILEIPGSDGCLAAIGWIAQHGYCGAISTDAEVAGLRLRCGNIQVGEGDLLNDLFQEPRFNSWAVGEIHVLDERILPNGRRDHFEQSVHFNDLVGHLGPVAMNVSRLCRLSSIQRNRSKQLELMHSAVENSLAILEQRSVTKERWRSLRESTVTKFEAFQKAVSREEQVEKENWSRKLKKLEKRIESLGPVREHVRKHTLTVRERRFFDALYEVLPQASATKVLVDRILARMNLKS
jgi:hypothetical protein